MIPEIVPYYQAIYAIDETLSKEAKKTYDRLKGVKEIKSKKISEELEKNYLVSKTPDGFKKREHDKTISYEKALDWIITTHLGFVGPQAKEDIALELRLSEDIISQTLYDLEEQGTIQGGNFILGRNTPQYLLAHFPTKNGNIN